MAVKQASEAALLIHRMEARLRYHGAPNECPRIYILS